MVNVKTATNKIVLDERMREKWRTVWATFKLVETEDEFLTGSGRTLFIKIHHVNYANNQQQIGAKILRISTDDSFATGDYIEFRYDRAKVDCKFIPYRISEAAVEILNDTFLFYPSTVKPEFVYDNRLGAIQENVNRICNVLEKQKKSHALVEDVAMDSIAGEVRKCLLLGELATDEASLDNNIYIDVKERRLSRRSLKNKYHYEILHTKDLKKIPLQKLYVLDKKIKTMMSNLNGCRKYV